MYFQNYRLPKAWSLKWVKSPVSEHIWTVDMLNVPKQCLNLLGRIFAVFFYQSQRISVRKYFLNSI